MDPAPDFSYRTLAGKTGKLSDLWGKVVLVNLFATWCGPCRVELPHLEKDILAPCDADRFALICVGIGHGIDERRPAQLRDRPYRPDHLSGQRLHRTLVFAVGWNTTLWR